MQNLSNYFITSMSWFDITVFAIYLSAVVYNGIRASKHVNKIEDFATGSKSYSSIMVFATLSAAFLGGGFTAGLAEKTYLFGLAYVVGLWGFSLKELLIAKYIAPKMERFHSACSVGDIMGQIYGDNAKIFTGIASFLVCSGIIGAQFTALGNFAHILLGVDHTLAIVIGAMIIMVYTGLGGMRAVVSNDSLHFCVMMLALPVVLALGISHIGGVEKFSDVVAENYIKDISWSVVALVFLSFFFGETLVPPYVQRLLIGKDNQSTIKGNWWSGILSIPFFLMMGCIGLVAFTINPDLTASAALPFVILKTMPIGLKGLAIAGMIAIVMSSADSFLNAAAVAVSHDVIHPLLGKAAENKKLIVSRIATYAIALAGIAFSLHFTSSIDLLLQSYVFWTPIIIVPFVAGVMGVERPASSFWLSAIAGVITVTTLQALNTGHNQFFEVSIWGVLANAVVFFSTKNPVRLSLPMALIRK